MYNGNITTLQSVNHSSNNHFLHTYSSYSNITILDWHSLKNLYCNLKSEASDRFLFPFLFHFINDEQQKCSINDIFLLRVEILWFSARLVERSSSSLQSPEVSVIAYLFTKSSAGVGPTLPEYSCEDQWAVTAATTSAGTEIDWRSLFSVVRMHVEESTSTSMTVTMSEDDKMTKQFRAAYLMVKGSVAEDLQSRQELVEALQFAGKTEL